MTSDVEIIIEMGNKVKDLKVSDVTRHPYKYKVI